MIKMNVLRVAVMLILLSGFQQSIASGNSPKTSTDHPANFPADINLTGTWKGNMTEDIVMQISLVQNGDKVCGYSYDYVVYNKESYCKEYFTGTYNNTTGQWDFVSVLFIENSPHCICKHLPMHLQLIYSKLKGKDVFTGGIANSPALGKAGNRRMKESVYLERVSDQPTEVIAQMNDCMKEAQLGAAKATSNIKSLINKPLLAEAPSTLTPEVKALTNEMRSRDNEVIKTYTITSPKITISINDNEIVDGDTVSVFDNGALILAHGALLKKATNIEIDMTKPGEVHEFTMFAENLGRIPPNTAFMVITAGGQRFELKASATLNKNASIILKYDPGYQK